MNLSCSERWCLPFCKQKHITTSDCGTRSQSTWPTVHAGPTCRYQTMLAQRCKHLLGRLSHVLQVEAFSEQICFFSQKMKMLCNDSFGQRCFPMGCICKQRTMFSYSFVSPFHWPASNQLAMLLQTVAGVKHPMHFGFEFFRPSSLNSGIQCLFNNCQQLFVIWSCQGRDCHTIVQHRAPSQIALWSQNTKTSC